MLLPFSAPLCLVVLSTTLLWIVVILLQQRSLPLHPSTLFEPPQNVVPQFIFPLIFQCTPNLLM
jgi:hypothetical protein